MTESSIHLCGLRKDFNQPYISVTSGNTLRLSVVLYSGSMSNVYEQWDIQHCPFCGKTIKEMDEWERLINKIMDKNKEILKRLSD